MTGPLYVHTKFEAIRTLLYIGRCGSFEPRGVSTSYIDTPLVQDTKLYIHI